MPTISPPKRIFKALPTRERLLELFEYDQINGKLIWKHRRTKGWNASFAGRQAGTKKEGPKYVRIEGENFLVHRLIFLIETGIDPIFSEIDHADKDDGNNVPKNLRLATHSQNQMNKGSNRNNKHGLKGVFPNKKRFSAQIMVDRIKIHLGTFDTPEAAHAAYCEAAQRLHGKFARTE